MSLVLALAVVLCAGLLGTLIARRMGLPGVVGQMAVGLLTGPLVLGELRPSTADWLFSPHNTLIISRLGSCAAGILLFVSGATHRRTRTDRSRDTAILTAGNIAMAVVAAAICIVLIESMGLGEFSIAQGGFLVVVFAVCALPVLVRVIQESGLDGTRAARYALRIGITTDVIAWCSLVILGALNGTKSHTRAIVCLVTIGAVIMAWKPLRAAVNALLRSGRPVGTCAVAVGCAALGVVVAVTIGIDPLLGALAGGLLFGSGAPRDLIDGTAIARPLSQAARLNTAVLLPVFFASVGLSVKVGGTSSGQLLALTALVAFLAVAARVVGTFGVARWTSLERHETRTICSLVCARGATELVILKIGASLSLLPVVLYSPAVLMALITTALSSVLVRPKRRHTPAADIVQVGG